MIYITLLDQFHPGIYSSQVIDVCDYLNAKHNAKIRVVAFLSIKELLRTDARKKLKQLSPTAIILPAFPGLKNFKHTSLLLFLVCFFTGERVAICRNVFCTTMALRVKKWGMLKKIVFDGRSAITAEIEEYDVFPVDYLRNNSRELEKKAVLNADFRIAVSNELVSYWRLNFGYTLNDHVVIPCTLDQKIFRNETYCFSTETNKLLSEMGIISSDIVLAYSGSTAPWQSFELLKKMLIPVLEKNKNVKILFLSKENKDINELKLQFPTQIINKWVEHSQVLIHLQCCDYGILTREQSDTNKVASPVKFSEYLYAGLNVIISENLGDLSAFVKDNKCGIVLNKNLEIDVQLEKIAPAEKERCFELSKKYFKKDSAINSELYTQLIKELK